MHVSIPCVRPFLCDPDDDDSARELHKEEWMDVCDAKIKEAHQSAQLRVAYRAID